MKDYRQGDVMLRQIKELPENLVPIEPEDDRVVLMHGERTNHAHAFYKESAEADLGVNLFRDPVTGERFLMVGGAGAALKHEEHSTVELAANTVYRLPIQMEDTGEMIQQVSD